MVIPRSFSRSIESRTWSTAFLASMVPVRDRSRSARVDLPWSMWATMEKLRIRSVAIRLRIARPCAARREPGAVPDPLGAGAGGDHRVGLQDRGETGPGLGADPGPRAPDAAAHHRARAHHAAVPQQGTLDPGARAHAPPHRAR